MTRFTLHATDLWLRRAALGAALCGLLGVSCARNPGPPPVIVLLVDTLRADYLGSFGFDGPVSPHLDALARESYLFDRCYAAAPWTKPSIASLFTGVNPTTHGVTNHEGGMWGDEAPDLQRGILREDAHTLAERFREAGYRTAAFVGNPWLTWEYGYDQGFEVYSSVVRPPADRITLEAERWLGSRGTSREPFLLYLHFMDVHAPYDAPEDAYREVASSPTVATERIFTREEWERISPDLLHSVWTTDETGALLPETRALTTWRARYAAGVRDLDQRIGPFLERLRESGVLDRAYLVVTADHGEELFDHGNWGHGYTLYEDQLRVPLLIRPPGGLDGSRRIDDVVGLIDVMPTLLAVAGAPAPTDVEGEDLSPFFRGEGPAGSGVVFAGATRNNPGLMSLTVGPLKLIVNETTNRVALFNVIEDRAETRNLAEAMPEELRRMRVYLARLQEAARKRPLFQPATQAPTAEHLELLQSIGYMN